MWAPYRDAYISHDVKVRIDSPLGFPLMIMKETLEVARR